MVEGIIELVDNFGPHFYVHGNKVVQKMNGIHRKRFIKIIESLVLNFPLYIAKDRQQKGFKHFKIFVCKSEVLCLSQEGDFIQKYLSCRLGLFEIQVNLNELIDADLVAFVLLISSHFYQKIQICLDGIPGLLSLYQCTLVLQDFKIFV